MIKDLLGLLLVSVVLLPATGWCQAPIYLMQWGSPGSGPGQFTNPDGIAVDASGNVYVADTGNQRVQVFTRGGTYLREWGAGCRGGIALDEFGTVYVGDYTMVHKFTSTGALLGEWLASGCEMTFCGPSGIAVDRQGNVFVADNVENCIRKFTADGLFVRRWGTRGSGNGQFAFLGPFGVGVDASGNVYACDYANYRVQWFSGDGVYLGQLGQPGGGAGQFDVVSNLAFDRDGDIYVIDRSSTGPRIQKFTSSGVYLTEWGSFGRGNGQLDGPGGLAIDTAGQIYVADTGNHRIQVFGPAPTSSKLTSWGRIKSLYR